MNEAYYQNSFPSLKNSSPKRSPKIILTLVIILLFSGFIVYAGSKVLDTKKTEPPKEKIAPSPTEFVFPTESNSAEAESDAASPTSDLNTPTSETTSVTPTINPVDKTTGLNRGELSVAVQNGSGEVGAASKISETLKEFGYDVVSIGNADSFDYENTVIEIKKEKSEYLALLKKDLGVTYTIGSASATLSASSAADAVVIVGKQ